MKNRLLGLALLVAAMAVPSRAAGPLITTWRGDTCQGVMPASNLPTEFVWYDEDGPDLAARIPKPVTATGSNRYARDLYAALPGGEWPRPGTRTHAIWRVPLPAWSASSPVAVGDKVFVACEAVPGTNSQYTLVCVDIPTGRLDWVKPIDHLLAMPREESARLGAIRRAEVEGWARTMRLWNQIYWDNEKDGWFASDRCDLWKDRLKGGGPGDLSPERQRLLEQAKADGYSKMSPDGYWQETGRYGHPRRIAEYKAASQSRAYVHCHNKDFPWYGSVCASPVGDGKAVYAVAAPDAVVCYELDGTLRWAADMGVGGRSEGFFAGVHRHMSSPVLAEGRLIYHHNTAMRVFAWDAATGKPAWTADLPLVVEPRVKRDWGMDRIPRNYGGHMGPSGTPLVMTLEDIRRKERVAVVVIANGDVFRVADGKHLGWFDANGDVVYSTAAYLGDVYLGKEGVAHRLWLEDGRLASKELWNRSEKADRGSDSPGSDPNCHKRYLSLIAVDAGFITTAGLWEAATGRTLHNRLSGLPGHGYVAGFVSRDGLYVRRSREIGNHAITFAVSRLDADKTGIGLIVEGKQPDAVRQAAIDRFGMSRIHMGWSHPTAHGNRIFVKTNAYLYAFGSGDWQPPSPPAE